MPQRNFRGILPFVAAVGIAVGSAGCGVQPKLSSLQEAVFTPSCASMTDCHSAADEQGGLILAEGLSYLELIDVMAEGDPDDPEGMPSMPMDEIRVIPGDPDNSFLVKKVENLLGPTDGARMPNIAGVTLSDGELSAIRRWVELGAPND